MKRSQFLAMQARRRAEGLPPYRSAGDALRGRYANRVRALESGAEERQVDLLNDLNHGRITVEEYRDLGGSMR